MVDRDDCSVTVSAARLSSLQGCLGLAVERAISQQLLVAQSLLVRHRAG